MMFHDSKSVPEFETTYESITWFCRVMSINYDEEPTTTGNSITVYGKHSDKEFLFDFDGKLIEYREE